jgi:hypothetical protein
MHHEKSSGGLDFWQGVSNQVKSSLRQTLPIALTYGMLGIFVGRNSVQHKEPTDSKKILNITKDCLIQAKEKLLDLRNDSDAQKFNDILVKNFSANGIILDKKQAAQFTELVGGMYSKAPKNSSVEILDTVKVINSEKRID